jgi:hypothetical protein
LYTRWSIPGIQIRRRLDLEPASPSPGIFQLLCSRFRAHDAMAALPTPRNKIVGAPVGIAGVDGSRPVHWACRNNFYNVASPTTACPDKSVRSGKYDPDPENSGLRVDQLFLSCGFDSSLRNRVRLSQ